MKILLIGPQGSGKSTQAELLAKTLNLPRITMGDIFRQIAAEDSVEGQRIREVMEKGFLVDDQTAAELVKKRLEKADMQSGFIMDGYPRTIEQVNIYSPDFDKVIYLNVPREGVVERLLKRGRVDDCLQSINKRLDLYYQQTQPLLDHYKIKGILIEIDGSGSIESIEQKVRESVAK